MVADVSLLLRRQRGRRGSASAFTLAVGIQRNQPKTAQASAQDRGPESASGLLMSVLLSRVANKPSWTPLITLIGGQTVLNI